MLCRVSARMPRAGGADGHRRGLQADRRRAAARRLPRRHAVTPRGRRVPRQRGDGLVDRAAHDPPRRAVRRRCRSSSGSTSTRPPTSSRWSLDDDRAAPPDRGVRRGGQQHRPEGRPPPADPERPRLRRRPRRDVLDGAQAPDASSGAGAASRSRPMSGQGWRGSRDGTARRLGPRPRRAPLAARDRRDPASGRWVARDGPFPAATPRLAGDPVAAVLSVRPRA